MNFEHDNLKPEHIKEEWEGQLDIFSWLEFVSAIPQVLFVVTTIKENGLANAAFQSWSCFTGEGNDFFIIMSGVMKHTHTYQNIKRDKEFCVNFLGKNYLKECRNTVRENEKDIDEIVESGFSSEECKAIKGVRIKEGFLKLECRFEWEKELIPDSNNIMICGRLKHISVKEDLARGATSERYGEDSFMFNLHNPMNPFTGDFLGSGTGIIRFSGDL